MDSFLVTMTPSTAEKQLPRAQREASASGIDAGLSPFEEQLTRELEQTSRVDDSSGNGKGTEASAEKPAERSAEKGEETDDKSAEGKDRGKSSDDSEMKTGKEESSSGEETAVLSQSENREKNPVPADKDKSAADKKKQFPAKPAPAKTAHAKTRETDSPPVEAGADIPEKPDRKKPVAGDTKKHTTGKIIKDTERKAGQIRSGIIDEKTVKESGKNGTPEKADIRISPETGEGKPGEEKAGISRIRPEGQEIKPEAADRSGAEGIRKTDESGRGFTLHVTDRRTGADKERAKPGNPALKTSAQESQGPDISAIKSDVSAKGTFQLRHETEPPGVQFQRVFRNVQEQMQGDFVRSARLVLKNGGNGEIRLLLKPEELGSIRIKMEVGENRITGRIIVDSPQARETMEQNLPSLYKALKESGFESASLDISLGNREGEGETGNRNKKNSDTGNIRQAAGEFERNTIFADINSQDTMLVNLMV